MNVFDLFARLVLDPKDYEEGLDKAEDKAKAAGEKIGKSLSTVAKAGTAAITAGVTAVGALGTQAVKAYAEYEQLAGGVETLFGKSADVVAENAEKAFKTAGLSANEYMDTVTSFSASLLQSLGGDTEKASKIADMAIIDMSDNANKMGTDMSMIQNAYQGFAKQNYTMLDNLKLGYGGTKEEMERLLKDAQKLPKALGKKFDISNYADVVEAIHLIQENMDIAGTTAKEAGTTISGSIGMMKAAWADLTTEIVKPNGNIGQAVDNLVTTITGDGTSANKGVIGNLMPAIEKAIDGVAIMIDKLAPVIADKLPGIIDTLLPPLISAAGQLVSSLIENAPQLLGALAKAIMGNPEVLLLLGPKIIGFFIKGFTTGDSLLFNAGKNIITKIGAGINSAGATLTSTIGPVLTNLAAGIVSFFAGAEIGKKVGAMIFPDDAELYEHYSGIMGTIEMIKDAAIGVGDLITMDDGAVQDYKKYTENVIEKSALRQYKAEVDELTESYREGRIGAEEYVNGVHNLIESSDTWAKLATDVNGEISRTAEQAQEVWDDQSAEELANHFADMAETITVKAQESTTAMNELGETTSQIVQNTEDKWTSLNTANDKWGGTMDVIRQSTQALSDTTTEASTSAVELGNSIDATSESVDNLGEKVQLSADMVASMLEQLKAQISDADWVEIWSPIKTGFDEFWVTMVDRFSEIYQDVVDAFTFDDAVTWGQDLMDNFISGVEDRISQLEACLNNIAQTVRDYIGFSEPKKGPLSNFHTYAPDMMDLFAEGIRDNAGKVVDEFNGIEFDPTVKNGILNLGSGSSNINMASKNQGGSTTVVLELDKVELGRAVYNLNNEENQRMGVRLAGGVL